MHIEATFLGSAKSMHSPGMKVVICSKSLFKILGLPSAAELKKELQYSASGRMKKKKQCLTKSVDQKVFKHFLKRLILPAVEEDLTFC